MKTTVDVPVTAHNGGQHSPRPTRTEERPEVPPVDILESPEALTIIADVPGVGADGLRVHIEDEVLTIEARPADAGNSEDSGEFCCEFALLPFFRQFTLPKDIDPAQVTAELKSGVLAVRLPKAPAAKPRVIEIQVGD